MLYRSMLGALCLAACGSVTTRPDAATEPCGGSCIGDQTCSAESDTCACPAFFEVADVPSGCRIQPIAKLAGATDPSGIYGNTCMVTETQQVRCWGYGGESRNGVASTNNLMDQPGEQPSIVQLDAPALSVEVGVGHSCALLDGGSIQCWGPGFQGQLGDGMAVTEPNANAPRPPVVTLPQPIAQVATGGNHTCVRVSDGTVSCWGGASSGETGGNDTAMRVLPGRPVPGIVGAIDLDLGFAHSCAVVAGGAVRCWGEGFNGQLGAGTDNLMDGPDEQPSTVAFEPPAVRVIAGGRATCAILESGAVRCWGSANVVGTGADSAAPIDIPLAAPAVQVAISNNFGAALLANGQVQIWGNAFAIDGRQGQPGLDVRAVDLGGVRATHVGVADFQLCVTLDTDRMSCWGEGFKGEFGAPVTGNASDREFAPITTELPY